MSDVYFTISLDPNYSTIDSTNLPDDLKKVYIDNFTKLLTSPVSVDECITNFQAYDFTRGVRGFEVLDSNTSLGSANVSVTQPLTNTVSQLDMDGNIIISSSQPNFSNNKEEAKEILGSVEKISNNEVLIADPINKRAMIVNTLTNKIKWVYISDRYIVDAHLVIQSPITISIDRDDYASEDITIHTGQIVIWENLTSAQVTLYVGDITGIDIHNDFDFSSNGITTKLVVLDVGERWSKRFNDITDFNWFSYPNGYSGSVIVSNEYTASNDQFIILESDSLDSEFSSKVKKIDAWGNVLSEFSGMVKPRDARPQLNNKVLIST